MRDGDPTSWVSRAFSACLLILLGAMALQGAVRIVEGIWTQLVLIVAVAALLASGIALGLWWWRRF